jgi:hypothetical protein
MSLMQLILLQRNEISEYHTYMWLAKHIRDEKNRKVLERIANEELCHYEVLKQLTNRDVKPRMPKVIWYRLISRVLGLSFSLRLMEQGERYFLHFFMGTSPYISTKHLPSKKNFFT